MQEIIVDKVSVQIKNVKILDDISISMEKGKRYGLRGRNGSGKTVLMKCICGFMKTTSGTITVCGKRIGKDIDFLPNAGIIIEEPGFFTYTSGYENLKLLAGIKGIAKKEDICNAMDIVGLDYKNKKKVGKYSLGMRQRLAIAQAVMEKPDILILDEPTNGLDEDGIEWFRNFLKSQKEQGKIVLIASHSKEDLDLLCDQIWRIDKGRLIG